MAGKQNGKIRRHSEIVASPAEGPPFPNFLRCHGLVASPLMELTLPPEAKIRVKSHDGDKFS